MTATVELTKRTALEEMIIRNNKAEMSEMIIAKQKALAEAKETLSEKTVLLVLTMLFVR